MNLNAAEPELKALITSRAREGYEFAGANVLPIDFHHGTKRKIDEVEEEEEGEEEEEEEERPFTAYDTWVDQVMMTRRYLTDNHRQMKAQGVDLPYFKTYLAGLSPAFGS